jgi:hypothetical protein
MAAPPPQTPTTTICYLYNNAITVLFDTCVIPSGLTTIPQILKYGAGDGGPKYYTYSSTVTSGNLTYMVYQHQPSYIVGTGRF